MNNYFTNFKSADEESLGLVFQVIRRDSSVALFGRPGAVDTSRVYVEDVKEYDEGYEGTLGIGNREFKQYMDLVANEFGSADVYDKDGNHLFMNEESEKIAAYFASHDVKDLMGCIIEGNNPVSYSEDYHGQEPWHARSTCYAFELVDIAPIDVELID